jgi:serine/threonine protein kinase
MALDAPKQVLQSIGNYDLLEKIADGGMGTVYRGRQRDTGEIVAVKIVAPHLLGNEVLLKRFEQEYNAARQLNHRHIVRALEYNGTASTPFLVMEYVDGESLGQKLEREGRMPEADAKHVIAQIARALHRAHREKLIHRDVKPDNILVTHDGQAKLTDLGLVKEVETDLNLTRTGRGLGTPNFMAPEQFKNAKNVDPRCDIYSLAATLYMMITGEMPFLASGPLETYMKKRNNDLKPPRELVPSLSERIDWAIRRAMSPEPELRPATCREFVEDLYGRSTRKTVSNKVAGEPDVWYLVYKDRSGVMHTVKGGTAGIRRSIKEGLLGDTEEVRASRTKKGSFQRLRNWAEFRDLLIVPAPLGEGRGTRDDGRGKQGSPGLSRTVPLAQVLSPSSPRPGKAPEPAGVDSGLVPQIDLGKRRSAVWPEWTQWCLVLLLMALSAVAGFLLLPFLNKH